jgi:hypothetical protein
LHWFISHVACHVERSRDISYCSQMYREAKTQQQEIPPLRSE